MHICSITNLTRSSISLLAWPQIVESDVGATITGVQPDNQVDYLLELVGAVARGDLKPAKFPVAVKAAAVQGDLSHTLAHILWCDPALVLRAVIISCDSC